MRTLNYYGLYLLRNVVDLLCIVFILRVFFLLSLRPTLKRMIFALPVFLLLSLLCAYSYTLSERNVLLSLLAFIYNYSGMIAFAFSGFKGIRKNALYFLFAYEIIVAIVIQTSMFAFNVSVNSINVEAITSLNLANTIWGLVVLALLVLTDRNIIFRTKSVYPFDLPNKLSFLIVLTLFCVALLENNILQPDGITELSRAIMVMIMALFIALIIYLLIINSKKVFTEKMVDTLSKQIAIQVDHYKTLMLYDEKMLGFRHDFINMMTCLRVILESGDIEQAKEYIENFRGVSFFEKNLFDSGNYIVDAMLNIKSQEAAKYNATINLSGFIPSMKISTIDLCIVMTNALDNAIEACAKLEDASSINIESIIRNGRWFIFIDNPVPQPVNIVRNMIVTSKKERMFHGYGLRNIERVVQKYSGSMSLKCENCVFTFSAWFVLDDKLVDDHPTFS